MGRGNNRLADALDDENINYIQERLQERLELKNDKQYDAADEIRDELRERFGVSIDDRMQEWVIEVDQYSVVDNSSRLGHDTNPLIRQQSPPSSYTIEDDSNDYDINRGVTELDMTQASSSYSVESDESNISETNGSYADYEETMGHDGDTSIPNETIIENLTIPELKERLRAAGLPVSGKKSELIERLSQSS
jgi:SAP domain